MDRQPGPEQGDLTLAEGASPVNEKRPTGGIGLFELASLVWRSKLLLVAAMLTGGLLGLAATMVIDPIWRATALLQIGQVGQTTPSAMNPMAQELVESPTRAIERVHDPVFTGALLTALGLPIDDADNYREAVLIRGSLRVTTPKGSDLLELKVEGSSRDSVRKTAETAVALLAKAHERIAEPTLLRIRSQLKAVSFEIGVAIEEREKLHEIASRRDAVGIGNRFAESVLLGDLLSRKDRELRELRDRRLQLEEQLSASRTFPTALLSDIHVPVRPASPKRSLFAAGGAMAALFATLLWILARRPRSLPPLGRTV